MKIITDHRSPNKNDQAIAVGFVVVHYTGTTLRRTLEIFMNPARQASSHIVIDRDGAVYEVVPCFEGRAQRAWHAGVSRLEFDGQVIEGLNDFSIGIELVNPNGNVFSYSDQQYRALNECLERLAVPYPVLCDPRRIVGHEAIAGFRGKCDPGLQFDWARVSVAGSRVVTGTPVAAKPFAEKLTRVFQALAPGAFQEGPGGALGYQELPSQVTEAVCEALSTLCEEAHDRRDK